ncbi:MAG: YhbY family RNA-binding protein [Gammaproteobacteria bacterium]|nr:YhbY family RNA-binding protein [Gammaproteobacteria bacterium]
MELTAAQRRRLAARAHSLRPAVRVGDRGLTASVLAEVDHALLHHELIKVRIQIGDRDLRQEILEAIRDETGAALIKVTGRVGVLFRRNPEQPRVTL